MTGPIDEQATSEVRPRRPRGIFLLPNLLTTGTLFAGFYAIIAATQGRFDVAAIAIFAAMLTDALDGRVARLTHTETDFGIQYDSLADLVAFGLATSLTAYIYSLHGLAEISYVGGKIGWLAAFFYAAAAALRLARFNIQRDEPAEKPHFVGLPSPAGAGVVAGFVWVGTGLGVSGTVLVVPVFVLTVGAAALMVSNIRYPSFKHVKFSERVPFTYIVGVVFAFMLISLNPPRVLFGIFLAFALSGPVMALVRLVRRRAR